MVSTPSSTVVLPMARVHDAMEAEAHQDCIQVENVVEAAEPRFALA